MLREWISILRQRLGALAHRRRLERDLEDEIAFHLAMREQELRSSGADSGAAARGARRRFDNRASIKESTRELGTFRMAESVWSETPGACRCWRNC